MIPPTLHTSASTCAHTASLLLAPRVTKHKRPDAWLSWVSRALLSKSSYTSALCARTMCTYSTVWWQTTSGYVEHRDMWLDRGNMKKRKLTIIIPAGNDSPDLYPSGGRGLPTVVRDLPTAWRYVPSRRSIFSALGIFLRTRIRTGDANARF